jgi:predicted tellurium resistance membrane protein TerC
MTDLLTIENLLTLLMLVALQAVLGFDNLLYISLESKRAPEDKQSYVRKVGISVAIVLRLVLLFVLVQVMNYFIEPFAHINWGERFSAAPSVESLIVLFGGAFIVYTAIKEIWHMIGKPDAHEAGANAEKASTGKIIAMIIIMNLVFSFDSILSAMALTNNFIIMATAVVISGVMMIWLSDNVSKFLAKNRMYEVLGLFILLIVGVMLISEGGHKAELVFWGNHVTPMSKTTFYFVIVILVLTDIVQSAYQKRLMKKQ